MQFKKSSLNCYLIFNIFTKDATITFKHQHVNFNSHSKNKNINFENKKYACEGKKIIINIIALQTLVFNVILL